MGSRAHECVASEWMTPAAAAVVLGISTRTAYRWIDRGHLPGYRFGPHKKVKRVDVERLLAEGLPL